ncbi:MAG: hypothetical protein Q7K43_00075 [Candidatus Woesearchaeota archaeon]|nr:hypothetical protein [Candidatus Woesearchaeota archaeon]
MKNIILLLAVIMLVNKTSYSQKSIPAKWHHGLSSTYLIDYKKGEHLIMSSIYTGTLSKDAVQKYGLDVKVTSWGKPFTTAFESKVEKTQETLTVTLYETDNPKEMKAEFEDVVVENGIVILRFCGTTILTRVN